MRPEEWQRLSAALDQALELTEAGQAEFLVKLRTEDPTLCGKVESLLKQDPTSRFEGPPTQLLDALAPAIPEQLGAYRIVKVLGAGGMGVVYQAEDTTLQRSVALKVMNPQYALAPGAHARFLREARAAAALHHDHVLPIYHVGDADGTAFLVMPLLQGETLEDRLRKTPALPQEQVLRIGRETAEGLAAAHAQGLIHRDIKPANLWLEAPADRVKIMDFGLALPAQTGAALTSPGMIVGTPAYMAPEQGRGEEVDGRADLFSLGCVLYRMCTGTAPFQKQHALDTLVAAASEQAIPPSQKNRSITAAVSDFILRLLAKSPAERPQSAQEVVNSINALERSPSVVPRPAHSAFQPWILGAAAFLIVLAASLGIYAIYFSPPPTEPQRGEIPEQASPTKPGRTETVGTFLTWKDWLAAKTKEQILTVARDGSGMYKTIGAAVDALEPGQVVKVLDKGPYREDLNKVLPEDAGLVSEVGTRLELPRWHINHPMAKGFFYRGASLTVKRGGRLAGFEIVGPEAASDSGYTALLMLVVKGDVFVESCRLLHRPPYPLELPAPETLPASYFTALHVDCSPHKDSRLVVRHNLMQGALVFSSASQAPTASLIEENYIIGWRYLGIGLDSRGPGAVLIRNNVIQAHSIGVGVSANWQNPEFPLSVTNNLLEQQFQPLKFYPYHPEPVKAKADLLIPSRVRFQNNIVCSKYARGIGLLVEAQDLPRKKWQLGHNCYQTEPIDPEDLASLETDLIRPGPFLSDHVKDVERYRRIAADSPLASAGAGGDLPSYVGPFPPGPAARQGDWFTRLVPGK